MPTLDRYPPALPPMSTATVRFLLGAVPALVTVIFAGVIALLALPMDKQRRDYAIQVVDCFRKFAAVLVGTGPVQDGVADRYDQRSADL